MKVCEYCGSQSDGQATHCTGCGTAFETEPAGKVSDVAHWARHSSFGLALTSGLGALFIASGIVLGLSKLWADLGHVRPLHAPTVPGAIFLSFWMPRAVCWLVSIGAIIFTVAVCVARCIEKKHGYMAAALAIAIAFTATLVPVLMLLLPSMSLGMVTRSSAGFYVGLVLQFVAGAWLLSWIGGKGSQNEVQEA